MTKSELFDLADLAGDAALVIRSDGAILYWSDEAERLFDHPRNRVIGRPCFEILEGRTAAGAPYCSPSCPLLSGLARRERLPSVDLEVTTGENRSKWVSLSSLQPRLKSEQHPVVLHLCHEVQGDLRVAALAKRIYSRMGELASLLHETEATSNRAVLSERECEVLRLAADGQTARQTAQALGVAVSTVRNHIRNAIEKLGRHSKIGAVTEARKRGLL